MPLAKLIEELRSTLNGTANGEPVVTLNLFGIQYAAELKAENLGSLAEQAGLARSFCAGLRRGMRLSEYVQLKR